MGGAIRETGGAKDETDGADQRKYSVSFPDIEIFINKYPPIF